MRRTRKGKVLWIPKKPKRNPPRAAALARAIERRKYGTPPKVS